MKKETGLTHAMPTWWYMNEQWINFSRSEEAKVSWKLPLISSALCTVKVSYWIGDCYGTFS
jgi:hypothetical protein